MSMKRTKARSGSRANEQTTDFWAKPVVPEKTWDEQVDGRAEDAFSPYALAGRFTKGQLVAHPKFGRGVVVDADALRIEILFQEGKKMLAHGQRV
jgi:hypothetical protein